MMISNLPVIFSNKSDSINFMLSTRLCFAFFLATFNAFLETSDAVIEVVNSWIRAAHPSAKANAGYMTLKNSGSEDVTLIKMENEVFDNIEVHEMTVVDGLMDMHEVSNIVIPAKGQIQFEPGGKHLMLKGPREHLSKGQTVDLILTFKSGKKQTVSINVAAR